ncbi:hypothetical protein HKCCE3408_08210 [Rhodobacterales bacterium HKCCE3408]|nr:hypothetical protein [Rhodobacterales bacterium HKCCE3408]
MRTLRHIRGFADRQSGTITIEALFWVITFSVLMTLISSASNTFYRFSEVQRHMQDSNRAMSIGLERDPDVTAARLEAELEQIYGSVTVSCQINGDVVSTVVQIPWSSLPLMGRLARNGTRNVEFRAAHILEWS